MADGINTIGTKVYTSATKDSGFTQLPRVTSVGALSGTPEQIDITDLEDTSQSNVPGVKQTDSVDLGMNYTAAQYKAVYALANIPLFYLVALSDGSGFRFQGRHTVGINALEANGASTMTTSVTKMTDEEFIEDVSTIITPAAP